MRKKTLFKRNVFVSIFLMSSGLLALAQDSNAGRLQLIIDQVQHNPGEKMTETKYMDPAVLSKIGHNGQVITDYRFIQCLITYEDFDPRIFPKGSKGREWVDEHAAKMDGYIAAAKQAGIKIFYQIDALVFPKKLVELYGDEICDEQGEHIILSRPKTLEIYRYMLGAIFERFPDLDGFVVRTGETYNHNIPFHKASDPVSRKNKAESHKLLIEMMREELCVKRNKWVIYRTWDFNFWHNSLQNYLTVTDQIEPHPLLAFSTKHQKGDFHRMSIFNPTLNHGKHQRLAEVQCQLEAYGKGAHPYYNGQGVIDGWEEYEQTMGDKKPKGLRDMLDNPQFVGIWTWSRGGGWGGPYLKNEFWVDLNTYVVTRWAKNPTRSEEEVFNEFAHEVVGIKDKENLERFRKIALLSAAGVLRGHNSMIQRVNEWWTRDKYIKFSRVAKNLEKAIGNPELTEALLKEKDESVAMWQEIEKLSRELKLKDEALAEYIRTSCTYGRIKYDVIRQGWIVILLGKTGDKTGEYEAARISAAIKRHDQLWEEWKKLEDEHSSCATIYQNLENPKGEKNSVLEKYRHFVQ